MSDVQFIVVSGLIVAAVVLSTVLRKAPQKVKIAVIDEEASIRNGIPMEDWYSPTVTVVQEGFQVLVHRHNTIQ